MAVSHVLSSPIADFTGTVTVFDSAGSTQTANATEIVRPSDWNSAHNQFLTLAGNTAGQSTLSGTNIVWAGGPNVTLSANAGTVSVSVGAGGAGDGVNLIAAGSQTAASTGTVVFSNSNGITFGMSNSNVVTASHNGLTTAAASNHSHGNPTLNLTNLSGTTASNSAGFTLSLSAGNYLTTARASNDAVGLNTAQTNVTWTVNSSGISLNAGAYLTTAAASNHSHGNPTLALTNLSGTTASNSAGLTLSLSAAAGGGGADGGNTIIAGTRTAGSNSGVLFDNANGITFGLNAVDGTIITASHNGLTTAALSNHSHGNPQLNLTNLSGTTASNSAGLTLSLSAGNYITTARASNDAVGLNTALTANGVAWTVNSSGISLNVPAFLTTAALSNHSHGASAANGSFGFQTLSFSNANGISFGTSAGSAITASHNALTTARASNDAVGLNTAQSNVTWTVNSSGISLDGRNYAGTGTTFNGTNASASITQNSAGIRLDLSVAAGGGGVTPVASASNGSFSFTTLAFSNANNVTFGTSAGSIVTASVAAPGAAAENNWFTLQGNVVGNSSASGSTIGLSGGNNITLSGTNGSVIGINAPNSSSLVAVFPVSISTNGSTVSIIQAPLSVFEPYEFANNTAFSSHGQNSLYLQRLWPENNYTFANIEKIASLSFVSSTNSQSVAHTIRYGLYSRDVGASSTRMTQVATSAVIFQASFNSNTTAGYTVSQSGGGSFTSNSGGTGVLSQFTAGKVFYFPFAGSMQAGAEYAFAFHVSTASAVGTSPARLSFLELTNLNNTTLGRISPSTVQVASASVYKEWDGLIYSVTTGALPASYQDNQCSVAVSRARQYLIFET